MVILLIVFLFSFARLSVTGSFGAVLGMLISMAGYYLTLFVWLTIVG